jgi:hypothetical protein
VWAALDCPGVFAPGVIQGPERMIVLGRLTARLDRRPPPGEPCIVVGWRIASGGRKT